MTVDKELIRKRKQEYGDSFEGLAILWGGSDGKLTPQKVALMLAMLKTVRLSDILDQDPDKVPNREFALEDTLQDLINYQWIACNYEEYKQL